MRYARLVNCGFFDMETTFPGTTRTAGRKTALYELELFSECNGKAVIDGREHTLVPNTALLCKPGSTRCSIAGFKCHFIHFDMQPDSKYAVILRDAPVIFGLINAGEYRDILISIIRHVAINERNTDSDYTDAKLTEILYMLACDAEKNRSIENMRCSRKSGFYPVAEMAAYMREHYAEKITLSVLAERFFYSPNYIRTVFAEITGLSPREYLEKIRLDEARLLLLSSQLSIGDISYTCGFSSQSYFTSLFNKVYGYTPAAFRRQHEDNINNIFVKTN